MAHVIVFWQIQKFKSYCTVIALFYFVFEGNFQVQAPGAYIRMGRFNGGFFVLQVWGAYIWRGLFSEFYGMFDIGPKWTIGRTMEYI